MMGFKQALRLSTFFKDQVMKHGIDDNEKLRAAGIKIERGAVPWEKDNLVFTIVNSTGDELATVFDAPLLPGESVTIQDFDRLFEVKIT